MMHLLKRDSVRSPVYLLFPTILVELQGETWMMFPTSGGEKDDCGFEITYATDFDYMYHQMQSHEDQRSAS